MQDRDFLDVVIRAVFLGKAIGTVLAVLVLVVVGLSWVVYAATHSITYTANQDTLIQGRMINAYNRVKCAQYGRGPGCTSANLTSNGCVTRDICQVLSLPPAGNACTTVTGMLVEKCTIFANSSAGQDAMMDEMLNKDYVNYYQQSLAQAYKDYRDAFNSASGTVQQNSCTTLSQPANCDGPGQ